MLHEEPEKVVMLLAVGIGHSRGMLHDPAPFAEKISESAYERRSKGGVCKANDEAKWKERFHFEAAAAGGKISR